MKTATILAVVAISVAAIGRILIGEEIDHLEHIVEHPFAMSSILLVVFLWLGHRALKAWTGETHDHD